MTGLRPLVRIPIVQGWYPKDGSFETGVPNSLPPTYPVRVLPKLNARLQ
jgi:hypothetical protein